MTILPTLSAAYAYRNDPVSINSRGQIVGTISANPPELHAATEPSSGR